MSQLIEMIDWAAREAGERRIKARAEETARLNYLPRVQVGAAIDPDDFNDELPDEPNELSSYDADLMSMLTDWPTFWAYDNSDAQWLAEPVIAEGRAHAIYAPGGTGKSLFSLWLSAAIACGRQGLDGQPLRRRRVLYLDYEMTQSDVLERLEAMGYDPGCDMSMLHYAILPPLPPADAPEGGKAIARMAQLVDAELVVLDTFSRAVSGDENDADTVRDFYRNTGLHLKAEGRAFVRIDHAGKDIEKGQRGSSAKNDDVDVVWQMTKADGGFKLTAKKRRMGWVSETVSLQQYDQPNLHYKTTLYVAPIGTDKVVADLDDLGVDPTESSRKAAQVLTSAGRACRRQLIVAAQKQRLSRVPTLAIVSGTTREPVTDSGLGTTREPHPGNTLPPGREPLGNHREPPTDAYGVFPASLDAEPPQRDLEPVVERHADTAPDPWAF